jgi:hypothetical protein
MMNFSIIYILIQFIIIKESANSPTARRASEESKRVAFLRSRRIETASAAHWVPLERNSDAASDEQTAKTSAKIVTGGKKKAKKSDPQREGSPGEERAHFGAVEGRRARTSSAPCFEEAPPKTQKRSWIAAPHLPQLIHPPFSCIERGKSSATVVD